MLHVASSALDRARFRCDDIVTRHSLIERLLAGICAG